MQDLSKSKFFFFLTLAGIICLAGGVFFSYRASSPVNPELIAGELTSNLNRLLYELDNVVEDFTEQRVDFNSLKQRSKSEIEFFTVANYEIAEWTGNQYIPNVRLVWDDFELKHIKTGAGDFLLRKWPLPNEQFLVAIIPMHIHYKIQNEHLESRRNRDLFSDYPVEILEANVADGNAVRVGETVVFRFVLPNRGPFNSTEGTVAAIFFSIAIVLFFIALTRYTRKIRTQHPALSFLVLAGALVIIRYLMVMLQFPSQFVDTALFDPKYFASSDLNPTLGDLLLNAVTLLVLCLFLFMNFYRFEGLRKTLKTRYLNFILSVFSSLAILFGVLFPFVVVQTIYNNSAISLAISDSVHFDSIRGLTFFSLVLFWVSSFLFIHVFLRILLNDRNVIRIGSSLLVGALLFVMINNWSSQLYWTSLWIGLGYVFVVFIFKLHRSLKVFRYLTFVYFFLGVIAFSISGLFAITHFSNARKTQDQSRFANAFLIDRDDFGEFLLSEAAQKIGGDLFIQTRLSGPFTNKEAVRQKVRQIFIPGYFNKYNIEVHLFGASGEPMDEDEVLDVTSWLENYKQSSIKTSYEGIFFISRPESESSREYLVVIPIKRSELSTGHIIVELALKRIIPDNVYPELLVDNRFQQAFRSQEFSYAVFVNSDIQFRSGDFNYTLTRDLLGDPLLYRSGMQRSGYWHVGVRDPGGRVVVVSSPLSTVVFRLADFSFLVILGLGAIMLYLLVIGTLDFVKHERLMLAARIQLILNLSFFVPLIAVSVITLGLTARSNQEQLNNEYLSKSKNFANEISGLLSASGTDGAVNEQNFAQLTKVSNLDANLFTPAGRLQFTSQPLIFDYQLVSPYINPSALNRINQGDRVFIVDERVGNLNYFVAYSALQSTSDGSLLGMAALPFFQSAYLLEKMQITVLANILSIFTAIFIVLLIISYWVSKWLTFPLRMITQKLGRISLTHSNQPLEWHSEDEIGIMVKEYNQMLATLSESKSELERTQRERAWREIAQQVAHEIKNPLTPIKLTLQKLERLSDDDPMKYEKIQKAIASILSQVDTLDGVASSFSTFAKMPEPVMGRVELIGLLREVITLHSLSAPIQFFTKPESVVVEADEQLLSRIFSNIILNSIQAARQDSPVNIVVSVSTVENRIRISFADNGVGIDENLREKIFLPHFSTKQSGSGLGLAIARQGIEQMGGKIYFESSVGKGTVFYIELPIPTTEKHDK